MKSYDLIVISSYPEKNLTHGKQTVGVASYTKNTLLYLQKHKSLKILVLAEKLDNQSDYFQNQIKVKRIWQRNHPLLSFQILREILKHPPTPILFEYEVAMLGNPLANIHLPLLLFFFRLFGFPTTTVLHQVIKKLSQMRQQLGHDTTNPLLNLGNLLLKIYYFFICRLSHQIIVFETFLKLRLISFGAHSPKIQVIPHGVEIFKQKTKPKIQKNTISLFGYLAWYKGSLWLANIIKNYPNQKLILAGGANPNHQNKSFYKKYLSKIQTLSQKYPEQIQTLGYIPQAKISHIYNSSQILVFPYLALMSSSGPLSLAFSYKKPFLLSKKLAPLLETPDIKNTLSQLNINPKNLVFRLKEKDFHKKLTKLQSNPKLQRQLSTFGKLISQKRSWANVAKLYYQTLFR